MAEHQGRTDYASKRSRTRAAHTRYLPSPPAATLYTRKNTRFRIPASSQHKPHATFMQPLQCILQHHVSNPHVSTHMATERDNNHAAITLRSAKQIPKNPIAHINNHTWQNTKGEPITHRNDRSRTRRTLQQLYTRQNTRFRAPASFPTQAPCDTHTAIQCVLQHHVSNPHVSTHMATKLTTIMQPLHCDLQAASTDSKKPYIAHINNHTWQNTKETWLRIETIAAAPAAHTRYLPSPPAATSHGKTQGFVFRLPPQHKPHATFMQPLQCVLQHHVSNTHAPAHMATKRDNNHAAITLRSAKTDSKKPYSTHQQPHVAEHQGRTDYASKRSQPHPPHTHTRCLSSPPAATLHRRTQGFVLQLPLQH